MSHLVAGRPECDEADSGSNEAADCSLRESIRRQRLALYIAVLALSVAVGHVVYAVIRDHVFDGSIF